MGIRIENITVDSASAVNVARFWAAVLGWKLLDATEQSATVEAPEGAGTTLYFERVPERKSAKNRLHFDMQPDGSPSAEVARLLELGASKVREHAGWTVMADLEGNEFCVLGAPGQ
jgi:hypothetical protein